MNDYVYLSVKLYLRDGQTEDTVQEVIQDMDYSFEHEQILDHEIVDITDTHLCSRAAVGNKYIDLYDVENYPYNDENEYDDS